MAADSSLTQDSSVRTRQESVAEQTRVEHASLLEAMHDLEATLRCPAPGREQAWHRPVIDGLRRVADIIADHVASADGRGGLLAEIEDAQPRLQRRVGRLRQEHADLLEQSRALQRHLNNYGADEVPDCHDIRRRCTLLLNALRHHQAAEIDLVYESFDVDIGGGAGGD